MTDDYQLRSWCDPYGHRQVAGLVGQLYFPTDIAVLDSQDLAELSKLQRPFSVLLIGRRVHFWCVGHADHRFRWNHNKELAGRRANSVKEILDQLFRDMRFYSGAALTSRGEMEANFPAPSSQQMASDRRVDLFSSTLPNRPPIELPMLQIVGRFPPEIEIREVPDPSRGPTNWTPATPTSRPIEPSSPPGDRTGSHWAGQIPRAMALLNQASVDSAIEEGLEHIRPIVAWRMMDHARGGILIVAGIDVRDDGRTSAGQVLYVTDYAAAVFAEPSHAIGRWRGESHLGDVPSARPLYGRIEYRYYWATRR